MYRTTLAKSCKPNPIILSLVSHSACTVQHLAAKRFTLFEFTPHCIHNGHTYAGAPNAAPHQKPSPEEAITWLSKPQACHDTVTMKKQHPSTDHTAARV